ncbi:MAG: leucine-rich repeat protein [Prevotellaceae bacterium]|nr:leucine-rich repeat protein [Candidatus Minthosoma equi]
MTNNDATYESGPVASDGELSAFAEGMRMPLDENGATCVTYKLYADGRFHFLKVLRNKYDHDPFYQELFRKEYEVGMQLKNEYFPKYEKLTIAENEVSLQMEFVDGETLESFIRSNPDYFCKDSNVERFLVQILSGLEHLHSQQVVHLDLKPKNILLTRVDRSVRIVDLGFCHTDSMPFTEGCTTEFAAPEQKKTGDKVDARTDIFAVGMLLNYINVRARMPKRFVRIMKRAMQSSPALRYQSAKEMLSEMTRKRTNRLLYGFIASAIVVLFGASIFFYQEYVNNDVFVEFYRRQNITFRILNEDSLTVEIVSTECVDSTETDYSLPYSIAHNGKQYSVVAIGDSAFMFDNKIKRLGFPASITRIGRCAFAYCKNLEIVSLPQNVNTIGEDCFMKCASLSDVSLSSNLREIPRTAFLDDSLITSIVVPEGVTHICQDAFTSCAMLESVTLPSSLEEIDRGVFYNCISLRSITIPANVCTLGEYTFYGCTSLDTIVCMAATPPSGTSFIPDEFQGAIVVPAKAIDAYRTHPSWNKHNIIGR